MDALSLPVLLFLIVLAFVLLIAWIVLPFAVLGVKPLLKDLVREQQATNELLRQQQGRRQA
jgi:hypothetical protein